MRAMEERASREGERAKRDGLTTATTAHARLPPSHPSTHPSHPSATHRAPVDECGHEFVTRHIAIMVHVHLLHELPHLRLIHHIALKREGLIMDQVNQLLSISCRTSMIPLL